ncbi:MAG TPA: hypothetical protein VGB14_13445, partial [Acidimicrobiales bacterium]
MAAATYTVRSPNPSYTGVSAGVSFADGVGYTDRTDQLGWFERHGYTVEKGGTMPDAAPLAARPFPRVGAPWSRDAAVEPDAAGPDSDAFLPPTNAGQADPHGPAVVSPGLHAVPPAPLVPGPVSKDPDEQERVETAAAEPVLSGDATVDEVMPEAWTPGGPLG